MSYIKGCFPDGNFNLPLRRYIHVKKRLNIPYILKTNNHKAIALKLASTCFFCFLSILSCFSQHQEIERLHQVTDSLLNLPGSNDAEANAREALVHSKAAESNSLIANSLYYLAECKVKEFQLDSVRYYLFKAIPCYERDNNHLKLAKAYELIAKSMMFQSYYTDSSLENSRLSVQYAYLTDSTNLILFNMGDIFNHFLNTNRIDSALHYLDIMQHLAEEDGDLINKSNNAYQYWSLYHKVKDTDRAMAYLNQALDILDTLIDQHDTEDNPRYSQLKGSYYDLGIWTYSQAKRYREAVDFGLKGLAFKRKNGLDNTTELLSTYGDISNEYYELDMFDSAQYYNDSCLKWSVELDRKDYQISSHVLAGKLKALKGVNGLKDCQIADEFDTYFGGGGRQFVCECYYEQYKGLGNKKMSLDYLEEIVRIKDSLDVTQSYQQVVQLEQSFQYEKKKQIIEKEKEVAVIEADKQRQQRNGLMVGSGLLLMAMGTGALAYRKTKKYNRFLTQEEQRKEALLQEVHHRTNNSLQLISALLTMQSEQIDDPQAKGYLQQSESRIHSMSALHELLHNNATEIEVNMADYLGNILDFHQGLAPENVLITGNLTSRKMQAKTAMPLALITNELITNSLKYAFEGVAKGEIHVVLGETDTPGQWSLTVSDNGKGLPSNAFQEGVGNVGSRLISILTRQVRGELVVENQNGAKVSVIFKV